MDVTHAMTHDEFAMARAKKGSDIKPSRFRKSAWRMIAHKMWFNHDAGSARDIAVSRRSLRAFKHRWRDGRHGNLDRHKIELWGQLLSRVYLPEYLYVRYLIQNKTAESDWTAAISLGRRAARINISQSPLRAFHYPQTSHTTPIHFSWREER